MSDIDKNFINSLMDYNEKSKKLSSYTGAITALTRINQRVNTLSEVQVNEDLYIKKSEINDIIKSEKEHLLVGISQS